MTESELMELMEHNLSDSQAGLVALGFIQEDILESGFEGWLHQPASVTAASFYECTDEVGGRLVDTYTTLINQEKTLDELGVDQGMRIDHIECMKGLQKGMLESDIEKVVFSTEPGEISQIFETGDGSLSTSTPCLQRNGRQLF